ncbi:MAG: DUF3179 domain-containing protein [Pseudomonadota bacterium]
MSKLRKWLLATLGILAVTAAQADPDRWIREGWKDTDFDKTSIEWSEIRSGGPPKDGIPSIDDPKFIGLAEADDLAAVEPVISLAIDGDARAYPLGILIWHEIVNDVVGGVPVAVTYCPLCNSSVVFDRRHERGVLEFGTTGKLRNSDLVMYDRQTESWWQQFTGEAIVGAMLGEKLKRKPAALMSFQMFAERYPDGRVLVPNNPTMRRYGQNPYVGYDRSARPFLYRGDMPDGIEPMARVVVVTREGAEPLIVSMDAIRAATADSSSTPYEAENTRLTWQAGQASALDMPNIAEGRDVGTVKAYDVSSGDPVPLPYDVTFAFVAHAFHPEIKIRQ